MEGPRLPHDGFPCGGHPSPELADQGALRIRMVVV